jgi:D-3-phosphoglycerate dehydrogenase
MRKKVFITEPLPFVEEAVKVLEKYAEVEVSERFYDVVPLERLKGCVGVIVGDSVIDESSLKKADELRIVQKAGAGVNTIDLNACGRLGIYVCNLPGVNAIDVAEYVIGAMIASLRDFRRMDEAARRAAWEKRPGLVGERLTGKKVGIIGLGRIGREVARLLRPFNVEVLAYDPYVGDDVLSELGVRRADLKTLLRESDIVTIHVPLTDETRGLIGREELEIMKPTAILINAARGAIVDEKELYRALKTGTIRFAVIDVWEEEPLKPGNPLFELENVQLSIHTASWTRQAFENLMRLSAENVVRVIRGERPINIVNEPLLRQA